MTEKPRSEQLSDEAHAILAELDALNEREEKQRTMGSMALSSYRSDLYHRAMDKFKEAYAAYDEEVNHSGLLHGPAQPPQGMVE